MNALYPFGLVPPKPVGRASVRMLTWLKWAELLLAMRERER